VRMTAFGLLALLATMVYLVFRAAGGGTPITTTTVLIPVPNLVGMTEEEASAELVRLNLDPELRTEASSEVEPGIVIRTEPVAGTSLPPDSPVFVYVSAGEDPVAVPTLVGQTEEQARQLLTDAGLILGTVTTRPDAEAAEGIVIEQSPVAGIDLAPGEPVDIVVSEGAEEFELPNLVGMEDGDAFSELAALDLEWDTERESSEEPEGTVIRTQPGAGELVAAGDVIVVVISNGPPPVAVPDLTGMTYDEAREALEDRGLEIGENAPIAPTDDPDLDGRVIAQSPAAGTQVERGTTVGVTLGNFSETTTTT